MGLKRIAHYPTNVLQFATVCNNKNHSAAFPEELPEWFIKLFTKENDWVLDPFLGSGTTSEVAQRMKRNSIGIEIIPEYVEMAKAKNVLTAQDFIEGLAIFICDKVYGAKKSVGKEKGPNMLDQLALGY